MSARIDAGGIIVGLLFLALGAAFLLDALGYWHVRLEVIWPAVLIALGLAVLVRAARRRGG
jgi:hypothetical protein